MEFGTAKITDQGLDVRVDYRNVGNALADGQPKFFDTEQEARGFCRQSGLRILPTYPAEILAQRSPAWARLLRGVS